MAEKGEENPKFLTERVLLYPKLQFRVGLDVARSMNAFVSVKAVVLGEPYPLGETETIITSLADYADNVIEFVKIFEVAYQIGIDDKQYLIFEVMDGDTLQTHDGYLFASVTVSVSSLLKPTSLLPLMRGNITLGYLALAAAVDIDPQTASIREGDKSFRFTSIPHFQRTTFFENAVMGFFSSKAPTAASIKKEFPTIEEEVGGFKFALSTKGLCHIPPETIGDGFLYLRMCANVHTAADQKNNHPHIAKGKQAHHLHHNLFQITEEFNSGMAPYELIVPEIKLQPIQLTGSRKLSFQPKKNAKLVLQVYVVPITDEGRKNPRLIGVCHIFVRELLDAVKAAPPLGVLKTLKIRKVITQEEAEALKNKKTKKKSFFSLIFGSKNAKEESKNDDDSDTGSLDEAIDSIAGPDLKEERARQKKKQKEDAEKDLMKKKIAEQRRAKGVDAGDEDAFDQDVEASAAEVEAGDDIDPLKDENQHMFQDLETGEEVAYVQHGLGGLINLTVFPIEKKKVQLSAGDMYEEELAKRYENQVTKWRKRMEVPFNLAANDQSDQLQRCMEIIDAMMQGFKVRPSMVVDLSSPCMQHLYYKLNGGEAPRSTMPKADREEKKVLYNPTLASFENSHTIDVMTTVYDTIQPFSDGRAMRLYAGGGVNSPVAQHWSSGQCRGVAFPLAHEMLMGTPNENPFKEATTEDSDGKPDPKDTALKKLERLRSCLNRTGKSNSWGGLAYSQSMVYDGRAKLLQGAMEASALYAPNIFNEPLLDDDDDDEEEEEDDDVEGGQVATKSTTKSSISKGSDAEADVGEANLLRTRYLSSFVGTAQLEFIGKELMDLIPPPFESVDSYNVDAKAINALLGAPTSEFLEARIVFWVLGKPITEGMEDDIKDIFRQQMAGESDCALFVICAYDRKFEQIIEDPTVINQIATPFKSLQKLVAEIVGENKSPFLYVHHHVSWAEVMANSFLREDKEDEEAKFGVSEKDGETKVDEGPDKGMPTHQMIYDVLRDTYKLTRAVSKRVVGLLDVSDLALDDPESGNVENPDSIEPSKSTQSLEQGPSMSSRRFSMRNLFGKKAKTQKKEVSAAVKKDNELLEARISGFAAAKGLKDRFDTEQNTILQTQLRKFCSLYLRGLASKRPREGDVNAKVSSRREAAADTGVACDPSCMTS